MTGTVTGKVFFLTADIDLTGTDFQGIPIFLTGR